MRQSSLYLYRERSQVSGGLWRLSGIGGRGAVGKSGFFCLPPRRRAGLYTTGRGVGKDPAALGLSPRALKLPEMHPECRIFSVLFFWFFFV